MKLTCLFLLCTSFLYSQGRFNPKGTLIPIEDLIGLLPDKESYYVNEEYFHNDSLIRSRIGQVFYNYGHLRVWLYSNDETDRNMNKIVTLRIVNDTFSIQTSRYYSFKETSLDSMLIYRKEGYIYKILEWHNGKFSNSQHIEYKNGMPVKQTRQYSGGTTVDILKYENGKLTNMETTDSDGTREISDFVYSDTLIISSTKVFTRHDIYITNIQYSLDSAGNILSKKVDDFIEDDPESGYYKVYTYTYEAGGKYTEKKEYIDSGYREEISYFPGNPKIEKYYWPNENSRMIKTFIQMNSH